MTVRVLFTRKAETDLARLDRAVAKRVLRRLRWLAENVETVRHEPLTGQWQGVYKLRVGDYRVLYTLDKEQQALIVHFARHRREIYRDK